MGKKMGAVQAVLRVWQWEVMAFPCGAIFSVKWE